MKIVSMVFSGILLASSLAAAQTLSPEVTVTDKDVSQAIQSIRQETTPEFWTSSLRDYVKTVDGRKVNRIALVATGGAMVGYSAINEAAMLAFKTSDPVVAGVKLSQYLDVSTTKNALKYLEPGSSLHQRYLKMAQSQEKFLASVVARGASAKQLAKLRWAIRGVGIIGGGVIGMAVLMFPELVSETASRTQDEMGEAFYESPVILAEALANPHISDEQLLETARRYPGFGVNLVSTADALTQLLQAHQ